MNINISQMPDDAKVWVYQNSRKLSNEEVEVITKEGNEFIKNWSAHGANLKASFDILFDLFIVIAVDEQQAMASGCSIDKSVHFIKDIQKQFNLDLFDRMAVAYRKGNDIELCKLSSFEKLLKEHIIDEHTIVFNNMVTTKRDFTANWETPMHKSWHKRILVS